jgi:CAAX protease family protein
MNAPANALPAAPKPAASGPVAPIWHTVLFLFALAALSVWSVNSNGLPRVQASSRIASYFLIMAAEWLLVGLVAWGVWLGGSSVASLIGEKWTRASHFFRDLGLAICFLVATALILAVAAHLLRATSTPGVRNILPQGWAEKSVWVLVALTAGLCEELMIRGYLQRQLCGLLKNSTAGILAQGIVFGSAHAYQGWKNVVIIAVLGCLLGWLAQWRRSLLPGMTAHFLQDLIGGLSRHTR